MTVRYYNSTDVSAPVLTGQVGTLVNLLHTCLVTGYGSKIAAGWTRAYTGTNQAAFLQAGAGGMYLAVDDSTTSTSRVCGYETMSTVTVGTAPFPTVAQLSGGAYFFKSSTTDATVRPWVMIADSTMFTLVANSDTLGTQCPVLIFGNIASYKSGDAYHKILIANTTNAITGYLVADMSTITTNVSGHWMARSYTQLGSSILVGKHTDTIKYNTLAYPHPVDGALYVGRNWVHEPALSVVRGYLRGVWVPLHIGSKPLSHGDTFTGSGDLAGKTFIAQNVSTSKQLFLEISDTW